jgi:ribosome recycling factor
MDGTNLNFSNYKRKETIKKLEKKLEKRQLKLRNYQRKTSADVACAGLFEGMV